MTEQTEIGVDRERKVFLKRLQGSVNSAYSNAIHEEVIGEDTKANLDRAKKINEEVELIKENNYLRRLLAEITGKSYSEKTDRCIMRDFVLAPNEVVVENPHDYPALVDLALKKLTYLMPGEVIQHKKYIIDHELLHGVPALGVEGVKLYYGIKFIKDNNLITIQPHIKLTGKIPVNVFESVIAAVDNPSPSDVISGHK